MDYRNLRRKAAASCATTAFVVATTAGAAAACPDRGPGRPTAAVPSDGADLASAPVPPGGANLASVLGPGDGAGTASATEAVLAALDGEMTSVGGIVVSSAVAEELAALLAAAAADGIALGGWGYRTTEQQVELRRQNCGTSEYAIWAMPASECAPATAVPGTSRHELGLAVDFAANGAVVASEGDPAYLWLASHAADYGFYNLAGEPWHWSTDGR